VYAGLFNLCRDRKLNIKIAPRIPDLPRWVNASGYLLYIEIKEQISGKKKKILFDLADSGRLVAPDVVPYVDYVSKRSFSENLLKDFPNSIRRKIHPYGVNYSCSSPNVPIIKLFLSHHLLEIKRNFLGYLNPKPGRIRQNARFLLNILKNNKYSLFEDEFRNIQEEGDLHDIFFITRLFTSPRNPDGLSHISHQRINLIEKLHAHFGSRFFGGIEDDPVSRAHCRPELLIPRMPRREYLTHMKNSRIVIVIIGANKSNPWKLGEALAASSCVVCGDLEYSLPVSLVDNIHYRKFHNPNDCIQICEDLLNNLGKIASIKLAAADYYENNIKSDAIVSRVIEQAFSESEFN